MNWMVREMSMVPNSLLLRDVGRARQARLRAAVARPPRRGDAVTAFRVRVGHRLISLGIALSGERVERPARHTAAGHPA